MRSGGNTDEATVRYAWTETPDAPVIQGVDQIDLACINSVGQVPLPSTSQFLVTAACNATIAYVGQTGPTLVGCDWTVVRHYEATDLCSQTGRFDQTFTYTINTLAPEISSAEPGGDFGCVASNPAPAPDFSQLVVVGVIAFSNVVDVIVTNGCAVSLTRTYSVENCCGVGDEIDLLFTWTLLPSADPAVQSLSNLDLGCISSVGQVPSANTTLIGANSACSIANISHVSDTPASSDPCAASLDRVYSATDLWSNHHHYPADLVEHRCGCTVDHRYPNRWRPRV